MEPKTNLITTLKELNDALEEGAIDKIKLKINWFHQDLERNKQLLRDLHTSGNQGMTQTDLILAVCRKRQAKFRNDEVKFRIRQANFRENEAEFLNREADFRNNESEFRNREVEFRNDEVEFRNREAEFRNNEVDFRNNEAEFCNKEAEFRNREAEFHNKEVEFRNKEAEFHNKEVEFRNRKEEFRYKKAEYRNNEAEFRNTEADFRNRVAKIFYYLLKETNILDHLPGADFDDTEVKTHRTEVFKQALSWDVFPMVEMLYDYWIGDLHWIGHDINKITTLGEILVAARGKCGVKNQQLLRDIHSLIKINDFQKKLYSEIKRIENEIKNIRSTEIANLLVEVLHIYDDYSEVEKIRIPHENEEHEREIKVLFENKSSNYMKIHANIKYEVYVRKLDLNVAFLILENWSVLRKHFKQRFNRPRDYFNTNPSADSRDEIKNMVSKYKEIERAIYHFIYRTCEDWRLYLPRDRQITIEENHKGIYNGRVIENLIITYDEHKMNNGPVLFLERNSFKESLKQFKHLLEKYVISVDPATVWAQTTANGASKDRENLLDDNYLTPTMYMSDYYSLRKIVYYIDAIENTSNIPVLMIERVLQVTGEMLKSSDETHHLLDSTKSMLQIAMSVETVEYLSMIRYFLSHVKKGNLSLRIDIVNNQKLMFDEQDWQNVMQDLKTIKQLISSVLDIYKPILDKSLLEKGKRLLDERIENLPLEAAQHIDEISRQYKYHGKKLIDSEPLLQELMAHTSLKSQILIEIIWIRMNKDDILLKIQSVKRRIDQQILSILPTYIQNIKQTLQLIDGNDKNVEFFNQQITNMKWKLKKLPNNPEKKDINDRQGKVEKIQRRNKKANVDSLLRTLCEIKSFSNHWKAINKMLSFCYDECELLGPKPQIVNDVASVTRILDDVDDICRSSTSPCKNVVGKPTFDCTAIEKLHDIFAKRKPTKNDREELISCLIRRVNLLRNILQYSQHLPLEEYLRKYRHDLTFRFELEMVLADIANVLVEFKIKRLMFKSGNLLRKIDLGNVLDHGNPFLDVIADEFDASDVATALLSKAIMFAEDGESIEALFELFKAKVDYVTIKEEKLDNMNDQQKNKYNRFQKSPNWKSYANLIKSSEDIV